MTAPPPPLAPHTYSTASITYFFHCFQNLVSINVQICSLPTPPILHFTVQCVPCFNMLKIRQIISTTSSLLVLFLAEYFDKISLSNMTNRVRHSADDIHHSFFTESPGNSHLVPLHNEHWAYPSIYKNK